MVRARRLSLVAVASAALAAAPLSVTVANAAPAKPAPDTVSLAGTQPAWAAPSRSTGPLAGSTKITFEVQLRLRSAARAEAFAEAVSTPGNRLFRHFLTPAQFEARFSPTAATVRRVERYLHQEGFTVGAVPANRLWVTATGTVTQIRHAFGVQEHGYRYKGHSLHAPDRAVSLPRALSGSVLTVTGLDNGATLSRPLHVTPQGAVPAKPDTSAAPATSGKASGSLAHPVGPARPAPSSGSLGSSGPTATAPTPQVCSGFWGQHSQQVPAAYGGQDSYPTYICGYIPDQLQTAYNTKSTLMRGRTGRGVTVAVVDAYASPTIEGDVQQWSSLVGAPALRPGQLSQQTFPPFNLQAECGGTLGWAEEETLDVEAVHGMAPGANILYVGAQNCGDGLNFALNQIVVHHWADIVSDSWGNAGEDLPADYLQATHQIFVQGAAEGIGFYFSSGDDGDNVTLGVTATPQPDYPASDPMVTAVGGTTLAVDANGDRSFELGWGDDLDPVTSDFSGYQAPLPGPFWAGGGGGVSTLFRQPAYQRRVVPSYLARRYGGPAMRVVPDVAMDADPYTGYLIGITNPGNGQFVTFPIGGTSLACPLFAGVQALASQGLRRGLGFANPVLYRMAGSPSLRDVTASRTMRAVTNPNGTYLVTFDRDSTLQTAFGYDDVTGIGVPNGGRFVSTEHRRR